MLRDDLLDGHAQRIDVERLGHPGVHAEALGMVIEVRRCREQQDGNVPRDLASAPRQEGLRVHFRHPEVEQNHIRHPSLQEVEGCLTACTDPDVPSFICERKLQYLANRQVVVHDEYTRSVSYHPVS